MRSTVLRDAECFFSFSFFGTGIEDCVMWKWLYSFNIHNKPLLLCVSHGERRVFQETILV